MSNVSTSVSNVIDGPKSDIPRAIFALTSSWLLELNANCANTPALFRSMSSRKKKRAFL